MKRSAAVAIVAIVLLTSGTAFAQSYPTVAGAEPFSAETNFMSLPGYLRWVVFQLQGQWLTVAEAQRIVDQQAGATRQ